jgi:hypothetical protein
VVFGSLCELDSLIQCMDGGGVDGGEVYLPSGLPTQWLADPVVSPAVDDSDDDTVVGPSGLSRDVRFNEVSFGFVWSICTTCFSRILTQILTRGCTEL